MSLYDLTTDWQQVYDMEDLDVETWVDTLESIEGEIKDKAINIGYVVKNLEADEVALAAEIKRLGLMSNIQTQNELYFLKIVFFFLIWS